MKAAGFTALFVNTRDYPEAKWAFIRQQAEKAGMICGPWARTAKGPNDLTWAPEILEELVNVADRWGTPFIPNCEKEIDFTNDDVTTFVRDAIDGRNAAVSTLARPMTAVDWHPLSNIPILGQLFVESQQTDPMNVRHEWFAVGITCFLGTYGSYGGRHPVRTIPLTPRTLSTPQTTSEPATSLAGLRISTRTSLARRSPCPHPIRKSGTRSRT